MSVYTIYPKEGETFSVTLEKVDFDGAKFTFYDQYKRPSTQGFLALNHIAAIVSEGPPEKGRFEDEIIFRIYLRERTAPIEVVAHELDSESQPIIDFYWIVMRNNRPEKVKVKNVFIAWSEVVAIIPVFPD